MTHTNPIKHTTADNYEHFLSYMYGSGARHNALLCQAYFDGSNAPHEEYEAYMAAHPEPVKCKDCGEINSAEIHTCSPQVENARLIAAAQDLLEALQWAEARLEELGEYSLVGKCAAAIAKATG